MDIKIYDGALISGRGWGTFAVPKGVDCIAFYACRWADFNKVFLSDGVTHINPYAFYGCRRLKQVTIPASVTEIGAFAFGNCESLSCVSIPPAVTKISPNAFHCFDLIDTCRWDDGPFTIYGKRGTAAEAYTKEWPLCEFRENGEEDGCLNIAGILYSQPGPTADGEGNTVLFRITDDGIDPEISEFGIDADNCPYRTDRIILEDPWGSFLYDPDDLYFHAPIPVGELYEAIESAANVCRWNGFEQWAESYDRLRQEAERILNERACTPPDTVSVETMREADQRTIASGTPATELMRRAAQGVFDAHDGWKGLNTVIVCGAGNNGGDGYALAEILHNHGCSVRVFRVSDQMSETGRYFYERCLSLGVEVIPPEEAWIDYLYVDIYVDCMLGTGFKGTPREPIAGYIRDINEARRFDPHIFVISVDINSGLNGDTGEAELAVESNLTVSIGSFKKGLFLGRARELIGKAVNVDIGIPIER